MIKETCIVKYTIGTKDKEVTSEYGPNRLRGYLCEKIKTCVLYSCFRTKDLQFMLTICSCLRTSKDLQFMLTTLVSPVIQVMYIRNMTCS
jgi:hypothetical protein